MEKKNLGRLNEDLKRELTEIIREMKDPRTKEGILSVTRVEAAQDLSTCKVFISVLDAAKPDATAGVVKALDAAKGHVRSEISKRMHIRRAPELHFIADENAAYAAHINDLLKKL